MTADLSPCTVGVEEEFLLVDAAGRPRSRADDVLLRVGEHPFGGSYQQELFQTQIEAATGVCDTLEDVREQVDRARATLSGHAEAEGVRLLASGTPPMPGPAPRLTSGERFRLITRIHGQVVAGYQACGLHVHVGVADPDLAVGVLNHLRPWLATLLALSANSPIHHGRDTGFASWRMLEQARFPGSGVQPWFRSAADYNQRLTQLLEQGLVADLAMSFWLARRSPRWPTVEIRVADTAMTVDDAVLQAALTRALVATALSELDHGREAVRADSCVAAVWNAARHGLDGPLVDPVTGDREAAADQLARLIAFVAPALEELGDLPAVRALLRAVDRHGTGAVRQRRAVRHGPRALLEALTHGERTPS
ncbi:carboxylate-amine ligase [Nonomuraea typhae]|uniref:carboxylate-amine ligase n=1 Tax=Nonomuraea typhae TaxID=2603600 RepID=UPI0012F724D9|nr:glutamate--cysteine ligase [Nonomuraea typhae]